MSDTDMSYMKPLPLITPASQRYWEALREHRIEMPACAECRQIIWPIAPVCPACWSDNTEWVHLSGDGFLSTWTIYHQSFHTGFSPEIPYNVAEVELVEGPRIISNVVNCGPSSSLHEGMALRAVFEGATEVVTLLKFEPRKE